MFKIKEDYFIGSLVNGNGSVKGSIVKTDNDRSVNMSEQYEMTEENKSDFHRTMSAEVKNQLMGDNSGLRFPDAPVSTPEELKLN